MRHTSLIVVLAASAISAQQTTVQIVADTPIGTLAQVGPQSNFVGTAAGTPIGTYPNTLNQNARIDQNGYASATTIAYPTLPNQSGVGVNFFERAYARGGVTETAGTSASATQAGATHAPHAILATFQNAPGTTGKIVFNFRTGGSTPATATYGGSVDVDNDGAVEFSATQGASRDIPYTIGASGQVAVRVTNECRVTGTGNAQDFASAWTEIWIGFRPDINSTCTVSTYGSGCNGVTANGAAVTLGNNRVFSFLVTGAPANSMVIAATGVQRLNLQLPGTCSLLTNAVVVRLIGSDGMGNATDSFTASASAIGRTYHQFLPIDFVGNNLILTASNGVEVDCVR